MSPCVSGCRLLPGHLGQCVAFWDGSHPPPAPTPPNPELCGCDESKVLRAELDALRGRLARLEGGA